MTAGRLVATMLAALLAAAACRPTPTAPASTAPLATAGGSAPIDASPPSPAATAATGGSPTANPGATAATIEVRPALLGHLPPSVRGVERRDDPTTAAQIAGDAMLVASIDALAVSLYVAPLASDDDTDYAVATVVHVRPGVFDAGWFRDWRDSFDAGVCAQAGGVATGRSEIPVDGRTVHRSTCVGAVVIHHVHLASPDVVVSVQGAGPTDLGRSIVDELAE